MCPTLACADRAPRFLYQTLGVSFYVLRGLPHVPSSSSSLSTMTLSLLFSSPLAEAFTSHQRPWRWRCFLCFSFLFPFFLFYSLQLPGCGDFHLKKCPERDIYPGSLQQSPSSSAWAGDISKGLSRSFPSWHCTRDRYRFRICSTFSSTHVFGAFSHLPKC